MNIRNLGTKRTLLGLSLAIASAAALATVTFDSSTGTGFVGKGDVQLAHGWNNAQLQANAGGVTFSYGHQESYSAVCTFTTGEGTRGEQVHNVTNRKTVSVNSNIAYDTRTNKRQITGFNLTGFGSDFTESGALPVVGGFCHNSSGGGTGGTWTSVTSNGDLTGGVYANYGGTSVLLP